jgi:flavin reductase (DIM6/NTAB) family NADH-FMN oxidoreductase RutF/rubredoxin
LKERGIETVMFDVSVTAASEIIAAAFKYSHLVFASCTYNAGIFVSMEELVSDLVAHNIQNRTVTIIENGSWAAASGRLIREKFSACKNLTFAEKTLSIRSAMKQSDEVLLQSISDEIAASFPQKNVLPQLDENQTYENQLTTNQSDAKKIDSGAFRKLSYGLFVLSSRAGEKESGCIINTMQQLTTNPQRVSFALNKSGNTHDMIKESGVFSASILSVDCPFEVFERFGFKSGREIDKLASCEYYARSENGMVYIDKQYANAMIAGRIVSMQEFDTHTLFVAEINEAFVLSGSTSMTYDYYFAHVKPKQKKSQPKAKGWRCKICGYVYEGEELAPDFVCPICKHGAADFEKIQ